MKAAHTGRDGVRQTARWLIAALVVVTAFIATPSLAAADSGTGTAVLSTDQLSYSPGGTVALSGAGFAAGDMVTVTLADGLTDAAYGSSAALVSSDGTFSVVDMALPANFMSTLVASATDSATGDTASTPIAETLSPPGLTPTITTDQTDYSPGSVVTISGSGWPAGDTISVFTDDSDNHSWSQTDQLTADASGDFTDQVTLPQMFVANYTVTASDPAGLTATTTFTDGNVTLHLPATAGVTSITVGYQIFGSAGGGGTVDNTCSTTPTSSGTAVVSSGGTTNIPGFGNNNLSARLGAVTSVPAGKTIDFWASGDKNGEFTPQVSLGATPCISANSGTGTNGNVSDAYAHLKTSNSPPSATVALSPKSGTQPRTNDTLTATATKSDSDGNPVTLTYVWKNGSTVVKTTSNTTSLTDTLDLSQSGNGDKSNTITVTVTPNDGIVDGSPASDTATVQNTPPVVTLSGANNLSPNEGATVHYSYSISDADGDTIASVATSCGTGTKSNATNTNTAGSFDCTFADGPASTSVSAQATDSGFGAAAGNTASQSISVQNVAPSLAISGSANVDEGSSYTLTLGAVTDPGADTVSSYVVHWGDGNTDTYSSNGAKTHTYADGPNDYTVTVDLVDEDGTFLNRANAFSVHVNNVAPSIAISGNASVDEGSSYSLTLGAVTDPGADTVSSYVVHWGDGNTDTYASNGAKTHSYADGPNDYTVTVDLVDEDGTFTNANTPSPFSVHVNNVAPTVTFSAADDQSVDEGSTHTYTYTISDPGQDTVTSVTTSCDPPHGTKVALSDLHTNTSGSFQCTFPDGPDNADLTASATDSDSDTGNTAHQSITVNNVAPAVTLNGSTSANEGDTKHYTYSWTDPSSADTFPSHSVDCGIHGTASNDANNATAKTGSFDCTWNDDSGSGTADVTASVTDNNGGTGSDTKHVTVANVAPTVTLTGPTSANEGDTKHYTYSWTDPSSADTFPTHPVNCGTHGTASNAIFDGSAKTGSFDCTWNDDSGSGTADVTASVTDDNGGTGSDTKHVTVVNVAPVITGTTPAYGSLYANTATTHPTVTFNLTFTDAGSADTHTCSFHWDDTAADTTVSASPDGGSGACNTSHQYTAPGVYTVVITVTDDDGGTATENWMIVVYDASAGFVTGGGWINVLPGSYVPNPSLGGRANFGFTSQYKKGATVPTGNTEFQFQDGNLNFHSENFNWLVVSGYKAQFKGTGTINGAGSYDFTLTAYDGDIGGNGQTGCDRFRIIISDHTTGTVVFDNRMGAPMDIDSASPENISGGSIVIHKA
jgi:hypothetical protein